MPIHIEDSHFKDEYGRTLMLRGVNLGGSSKVPYHPSGATHLREGFFDHRNVSFVGRPFPLEEADEHFRRLRAWGLTFLRFLVTWEAIEHAGPGIYDQEYLAYLRAVIEKAAEYGITVFIDPHQDVWSRFTGGDGAPGWTLEAAGLDMTRFGETGAALVHQIHGDPFPSNIWSTNEGKLAAATMFTLFFAGNDFAPQLKVEGEPVQDYLQRHYIQAIQQAALCLKGLPNVLGYDSMNEPLKGYIGWKNLQGNSGELNLGSSPTPFQAMVLGEGIPQDVTVWKLGRLGLSRAGATRIDPGGARAWQEGRDCVWRQHGVWDFDAHGSPRLLRPDYFTHLDGREVDFYQDYFAPFTNRYAAAIRGVDPRAVIFVEGATDSLPPLRVDGDSSGTAYAPHWYDGFVLVMRRFSRYLAADFRVHKIVFGMESTVRKSFKDQLGWFKEVAKKELGGIPTLIGEFGIPLNIEGGKAYHSGDFSSQIKALDRSFQAIEANLLHCTLWNYTADNTNARGDQWNEEDFSIFSRDQQAAPEDIHSGGRALEAVVRPYPIATAGEVLRLSFDVKARRFELEFRHDPSVSAPTEIFLPSLQYPAGCQVEVSDGSFELRPGEQRLIYQHTLQRMNHWIRLRPVK
jgi:hypothetical protein